MTIFSSSAKLPALVQHVEVMTPRIATSTASKKINSFLPPHACLLSLLLLLRPAVVHTLVSTLKEMLIVIQERMFVFVICVAVSKLVLQSKEIHGSLERNLV